MLRQKRRRIIISMRAFFLMVSLTMLWAEAASAAKRPRVPPGKWAVDYAKENCVLSREGLPGEPGVAFRTRPLSDEHDLLIFGLPKGQKKDSFRGRVERANKRVGEDRWFLVERSSGRRQTFVETTISTEELAETIVNRSVRLTAANGLDIRASLPNIEKALAALRACEEDLAKRWGVNPEEMKAWAKPAKAKFDVREIFWSEDASKIGMLQSHHVRAVLDIDEKGKPVDCKIVERSRVAWVNAKICETLLKDGKFQPAVDATGRPVRGKVITPRITSVLLR